MSSRFSLDVPVAYQGGKTRLASQIVDLWWPIEGPFWDVCCGSGAVALAMVERGFPVDQTVMVDAGPWGAFWNAVGDGTFDVDAFEAYLRAIPADKTLVRDFMVELSQQSAEMHTAEVFLLLQAASFGGKAIWSENGAWRHSWFRSYWQPTATSSRRTPVNPMMPGPDTLRARVDRLLTVMAGVVGFRADIATMADAQVAETASGVVYMDPPYAGTTQYGHGLDVAVVARRFADVGAHVWVSEGKPLSDDAVLLHSGRRKGGISGARGKANQEWVSHFGPLRETPQSPGCEPKQMDLFAA